MNDLPRQELLQAAQNILDDCPGSCVHFKFTCDHCGERCTFETPNVLYQMGECVKCGKTTVVRRGGFLLEISLRE